jgi:hypothetical protein
MNKSKLISLLSGCLFLQGCVGVVVCSRETKTVENPTIMETPWVDGVMNGRSSTEYTTGWLKANWGTPANVKVGSAGAEEVWTYTFKRQCWCGVVPMVVIPIPLVVPTGAEKVVFKVREGRVVSAQTVQRHTGGAVTGLLSTEGPFAMAGH